MADLGLPAIAAGAAFGRDEVRARRLGATGWIGPTSGPADALEGMRTWQAQAAPTPPEASALELAAEDLQQTCMEVMGERMPQLASLSPKQMAGTRTDVGYILGYLATSIDLEDDEIFGDFTSWLARVLQMRGVPPRVLDRSLDIIGDVVASAGMTEAARLCATSRSSPLPA